MSTDYSRSVRLGGLAAGVEEATLRERMEGTLIHLTADGCLTASAETLEVLVADLRRWPVRLSLDPGRGPGRLDDELIRRLVETATGIDPDRPLRTGETQGEVPLHLHVGTSPPPGTAVAGAPDGHGVRLRHAGHPFPQLIAPGTGLGAVLTAAMLAGEAFKVVAGLPEGKFQVTPVMDFCPVLPGEQPGTVVAPLPALEQVLLGGGGAIGTGIALVLDLLQVSGELTVVDREVFEKPNVTSYSIGTLADAAAGLPKVGLIDARLRRVEVTPFHGTTQASIEAVRCGHPAVASDRPRRIGQRRGPARPAAVAGRSHPGRQHRRPSRHHRRPARGAPHRPLPALLLQDQPHREERGAATA